MAQSGKTHNESRVFPRCFERAQPVIDAIKGRKERLDTEIAERVGMAKDGSEDGTLIDEILAARAAGIFAALH